MSTNKVNIQWLNTLRALATIGVILIHVSTPVVKMCWTTKMQYWWIGNVVDSAVRYAVPVFLMLSGATLLSKPMSVGEFYSRRFSKIVLPLLFWMIAYLSYLIFKLPMAHHFKSAGEILGWAWKLFLNEGVSKHFWYMYMIIFIYACIPYLGKLIRILNGGQLFSILMVWVFFCILSSHIPFNAYRWSGDYLSKFYGYFLHSGYLILGYYLTKLKLEHPLFRMMMLPLFCFTLLFCLFHVYSVSTKNALNLSIFGYLRVNTMLQSIAIFLLIKGGTVTQKLILNIINLIADYSYGIFMVHIMVLSVLFDHKIFWNIFHPVFSIPFIALVVLVISYSIVWLLRKIPVVNRFVG